MRTWQIWRYGTPEYAMRLSDIPKPVPGNNQSLIRVQTVGLNVPDVLMCEGKYQDRPSLPFTPGMEVFGTVLDGNQAGRNVIALPRLPHGGLSDWIVVDDTDIYPAPQTMEAVKAAAFMTSYHTSYVGLHRRSKISAGQVLLVHGATGGVGSAAIQLGKAAGAQVIATVRGSAKAEAASAMGADLVVDHLSDDFVRVVNDVTGGRGADIILDPVGGTILDGSRRCIAFEGTILVVGFAGGTIPQVPANHLLIKNYSVVGLHTGLYSRKNPSVLQNVHAALVDLWEARQIDPIVNSVVDFADAPEGLTTLSQGTTIGKVVVRTVV